MIHWLSEARYSKLDLEGNTKKHLCEALLETDWISLLFLTDWKIQLILLFRKPSRGSEFLLNRHSKYNAIHSFALLFLQFLPDEKTVELK